MTFDQENIRQRFAEGLDRARRGVPKRSEVKAAEVAISELIDCGFFFPGTKEDFAERMGWFHSTPTGDAPDRRLVEDVCNISRDQHLWPEVEHKLGGLVIAYAPSKGGMVLVDETGETPLPHLVHVLVGDLQHQRKIVTIHRRRQPTWKKCGASLANAGDMELARLFWQAESEIKGSGFVALPTEQEIFRVLRTRGIL